MTFIKWLLVTWFAVEALTTISRIGKPRAPLSNTEAITYVITWGIFAVLVVLA